MTLWFEKPANQWDEGLFFGNGRLGGIVFGTVEEERIVINEESVWSKGGEYVDLEGGKHLNKVRKMLFDEKYEEAEALIEEKFMDERLPSGTNTYQEMAELKIGFQHGNQVTGYKRILHLDSALVETQYTIGNTTYKRETFSSFDNEVIYIKISANKPKSINCTITLSREESAPEIYISGRELALGEILADGEGVSLHARANVLNSGGKLVPTESGLQVSDADNLLIIISGRTDYFGENPKEETLNNYRKAEKSFDKALKSHIEDYQKLFNEFHLEIGGGSDKSYFPTDQRLSAVKRGDTDPGLITQYVQLARYLLISSSRGDDLPANLQGLWAEGIKPPWNSDYHININIQMNYWISEVTGLGASHRSFLKFIDGLRPSGRKTAQTLYNASGWTAHHTTDAWQFTSAFGKPIYGFWPMGGGWSSRHFWEHYLFGRDEDYLRNVAYPVMKEASEFLLDYLVKDPKTGLLVSGPSISPENRFITPSGGSAAISMGPSMDHQIIWDSFNNVIEASEILGIDAKYRKLLKSKLKVLTPPKIGPDGRIMEWSKNFEEAEPGHRHMSHLYGLHPGYQFNYEDTPELMQGAARVIEERLKHGGGHTGWSRAWMINFYARLNDSEKARENIYALFRYSTLSNLLCTHPPFQIDGNFGGAAGIVEMLIQSHTGIVELGPAIPHEWESGKVVGARARGGYNISFSWNKNEVNNVEIVPVTDNFIKIRVNGIIYEGDVRAGKSYSLSDLNKMD